MRIIFFAGGTLGHIMPCVTLIKEIKKQYPSSFIILVSTYKDDKYIITKDTSIDKTYYLESYKLSLNIKKQKKNLDCYKKIKEIILNEDIQIAYGFGGYISGIGILAGKRLKLKTYLHEQNSVMGKANKYLEKYVDKVFLSYPAKKMKDNYELVGNPVFLNALELKKHIYKVKNKILFTSGTLGAKAINQFVINISNTPFLDNYDIYLITGKKYYEDVVKKVKKPNYHIYSFSNNLLQEIAESEIVISRAGATTLFEILGTKTLSIVIPSPNVTNNHQYHNAAHFKSKGCLEMIEEEDLSINYFMTLLKKLIDNKNEYLQAINKLDIINLKKSMIDNVINNE